MKVQQSDINDSNPELCALICERIATSPQGRITFAEYMNLALYHPQHGYYNSERPSIGKQGDFIIRGAFEEDGRFNFAIVECGAGRGTFAANLLQCLQPQHPDLFKNFRST